MTLKQAIKYLLHSKGISVFNSRSRWGLRPVDDILKLVKSADEIRCVFDVGANDGQSAVEFSASFPSAKIISFEPVVETFRLLAANISKLKNVKIESLALGKETGIAEITCFDDSRLNSMRGAMNGDLKNNFRSSSEVQVKTLDEYCHENLVSKIDYLKIDTEGFDLDVLMGGQKILSTGNVRFVSCESHCFFKTEHSTASNRCSTVEIASFLDSCGFRFVSTYTDFVYEQEEAGVYNSLYMSRA